MSIRVDITDDMLLSASERDRGAFNNFSFMGGRGNYVGFLGEAIVHAAYPLFDIVDGFDYDFIYNGCKIEVKTKLQTVPDEPLGYYEASVAEQSMFQNADVYIFCRIFKTMNKYPYGYIMGWIAVDEFLKRSRRLYRGQTDGDNGYVVRENCYNIRYDQLNDYE